MLFESTNGTWAPGKKDDDYDEMEMMNVAFRIIMVKITMTKTKVKMMKVNDIFVDDNNINKKDCTVAYLKLVFAVV